MGVGGRAGFRAQRPAAMSTDLAARAAAARAWLFDSALPLWWELGYDRATQSFHETIGQDGAPASPKRRVRVQARQTVVYARAGKLGWRGPWREAVAAGVDVLLSRCLRSDGGTRHLLGADGQPLDDRRDLYDLAFVLLALSEASVALARPDLIAKADEILAWVDANWALPQGGFGEGEVTPTPPHRQNPHMHLFEALLALKEATGRQVYLDRANALAALFRDKLFDTQHGALREYFDDAWRPMADETGRIAEPGHHFEWSWLLHRWHSLGGGDLAETAERLRVYGERYGVDPTTGAVYDEIWIDGRPRTTSSRLWPHTERLKASLARFERTRDPAAASAASGAFDTLMRYCAVPRRGLWRDRLNPDGSFVDEAAPASSFYHIMFAFFQLLEAAD